MGQGGKPVGDCWAQDPKLIWLSTWEVKGSKRSNWNGEFVCSEWMDRDLGSNHLENLIIYLEMVWLWGWWYGEIFTTWNYLIVFWMFFNRFCFKAAFFYWLRCGEVQLYMGISTICINQKLEDCLEKIGPRLLNSVRSIHHTNKKDWNTVDGRN